MSVTPQQLWIVASQETASEIAILKQHPESIDDVRLWQTTYNTNEKRYSPDFDEQNCFLSEALASSALSFATFDKMFAAL